MPYIRYERRVALDTIVDGLIARLKAIEAVSGDLNYVITRLLLNVLKPDKGWDYASLSLVVATLTDAKDEISRRLFAPYEHAARLRNGDLHEFQLENAKALTRLTEALKAQSLREDTTQSIEEAAASVYEAVQPITAADVEEALRRC